MTDPEPFSPSSRREARMTAERTHAAPRPLARHARRRRAAGIRVFFAVAASAALLIGGSGAVTAAVTGGALAEGSVITSAAVEPTSEPRTPIDATVLPMPAEGLPSPSFDVSAAGRALCDDPAFTQAIESGDDATVIAAAGGADAFRVAVATGTAPCIPLDDPARAWSVVNKQRPFEPIDFAPFPLALPSGVRSLSGGELRADAAASFTEMATAAREAGAGEIAMESAYRSYSTQQATYRGHVGDRGVEGADLVSARPGYSEHQSGLGADVVACDEGTCGSIDDLAATPQGAWVAEHAWEHGWIVRYLEGRTDVTGYLPEPWHLRYVGPEIARAYHEGSWTTLEEFFGLAPAPDYAG
ncbi:M15 family metallopeptidase [Microbacterium sp. P06]|uniref:M15 family metallopeptidase n=1 Tax=Microbacterium sp. P06 TaxID=3366949 RepID=UPI0037476155